MTVSLLVQITLLVLVAAVAVFCLVLAHRLRRLNDLEHGLGGAIAVMTAEIGRLEHGLARAQAEATAATRALSAEIERAKGERAFWALQQQFAAAGGTEGGTERRALRRRRARTSADDACTPEVADA